MPDSTIADPSASVRQCGRCRQFFAAPDGLHPAELKEWWACDDCSAAIIPSHRSTPPTT